MNKKIRIVTIGTYPDGMASTYRIHCYAKGLQELGVPIEVVAANSLNKYPGKTFNYHSEFKKVPYTILWNRVNFQTIWLGYLWAEIKPYILMIHSILTCKRFDIIWIYGIGLIPRLILVPFMHFFNKKVLLEVNEYPYGLEGNKITRIPIIRKVMQWATFRWIFPQLDGIVVISENLKKTVNYYAPHVNVIKIPILIEPSRAHSPLSSKKKPHPHAYVFHAGSLSIQKDGIVKVVEAYAKAATQLKKSSIRLDLILTNKKTSPEVWNTIKKILFDHHLLDHLKITSYLTELELHAYLRHATALIINKPSTFQNTYNFPTKLGDYLLSGRPVIVAAKNVELNNYLSDNVNSRITSPNHVEEMCNALTTFCRDQGKASAIGAAGRQIALDQFDYRKNAFEIKDFIRSL